MRHLIAALPLLALTVAAAPAPTGDKLLLKTHTLTVTHAGRTTVLTLDKTPRAQAESAVAFLGPPKRHGPVPDCPAGAVRFSDYSGGLQLSFLGGKLAGYWLTGAKAPVNAATAGGLRIGSPRAALGKIAVDDTSLGMIADVGGVAAALDEKGRRIDALYSGLFCIFD